MTYLDSVIAALKVTQTSLKGVIEAGLYNNEEQIKAWIKERWLTGKDSNGNAIGMYRFEDYAEEKYSKNSYAGFGNVDLTYSGAMGRAIQINSTSDGYEITSTVDYYEKIIDKYGDYNLNITEPERLKLEYLIFGVIFNDINKAYE